MTPFGTCLLWVQGHIKKKRDLRNLMEANGGCVASSAGGCKIALSVAAWEAGIN